MIDANVAINGGILYCDESVLGLQLGNGYSLVKTYIDSLSFKDKITDGSGQLIIAYLGSVKSDEYGKYLICLKKDDIYQIESPLKGLGIYTEKDIQCKNQVEAYNDRENEYLHKMFSMMRLFKEGNIGTKQIFFTHSFSVGIVKNTLNHTCDNVTRNITDQRNFILSPEEVILCNQFLIDYAGQEYSLLKGCIDEFVWGLEQVDIATGFEQYTTALEMTLLGHNQQGKKEVLAKRVAVMLESTSQSIDQLYAKMKTFYRFRSESLHEGDEQNITETELFEMENVVRRVLVKCLEIIKQELVANTAITWPEIKDKIINDLKVKVTAEVSAGTFVS